MPRPRVNYPSVYELLAEFGRFQRRRDISVGTIRKRRAKIALIAAHCAPRHVLAASTEDLERWLDSLPITARSRATYVTEVRAFYTWASIEAGYIKVDPARRLTRPRQRRSLPRPIGDGALSDALAAAVSDPRMLAILSLMAYEGLRCMEVSGLRGEDVDRSAMTLRVELGKGGKTRVVPLHPESLDALVGYRLPDRGPVFVARSPHRHQRSGGRPLLPSTISNMVSVALPGGYTAHQLRHWFGTMFYRASGGDLLLTQQMMGHAGPDTTAGYAEADVSKAAPVVDGLRIRPRSADGWHAPHPGPEAAAG